MVLRYLSCIFASTLKIAMLDKLKNISFVAVMLCVSVLAVTRYHHHDCEGEIFFRLLSSYELEIGHNDIKHCVHESDGQDATSEKFPDSHHSHPCSDDCWLSTGSVYVADNHKIDFQVCQLLLLLGIAAEVLKVKNWIEKPIVAEYQPIILYEETFFGQSGALRAPPAC